MAARIRRGGSNGLDAWPGYVDALSTLLMVIIFVLLVFVLAQAFLSVALSGRDQALEKLNRQMAELTDMLNLERGRAGELRLSLSQLNRDLAASSDRNDSLARQLATLQTSTAQAESDRDAMRAERDKLAARLADAEVQSQSAAARTDALQQQLADAAGKNDAAGQEVAARLGELRRQLDEAKAELAKTVQADRATVEAQLSDIAKLNDQVRALTALRDDLEKQAKDAAARTLTEAQRRAAVEAQLAEEKKLGDSARAQIALLNQQMDELRAQVAQVAKALDIAVANGRDKDAQIANLGQRLNTALAAKVEELQRYRSEFFGKLRAVLADKPGITVVGDRFVFQSEVLFPVGSADLTQPGQEQIRKLAQTIKQIAYEIPDGVNWVLRVDGHADRQKMTGNGAFASNWELSSERAINVVKLLIAEGVPPEHLAATGFADYQPLDNGDTPDAYARNRRIELRLTDR
jgi:chemotaxis protein MotB